jgi:hypothetical protein
MTKFCTEPCKLDEPGLTVMLFVADEPDASKIRISSPCVGDDGRVNVQAEDVVTKY